MDGEIRVRPVLSVLGCKAYNILPRKELIEKFCIVLYHRLSKEFLSLLSPRSKGERERRDKGQRRFLKILMELKTIRNIGTKSI